MDAKYIIIKKYLLDIFKKENYKFGDQIPTEKELIGIFKVSRNTVRQGIKSLTDEGYVKPKHGKGTFFVTLFPQDLPDTEIKNKGLIGLGNFFIMDYIYPDIIRGIEETLYESGYSPVLSNSNRALEKEMESLKRFVDQGVKGIILDPSKNHEMDSNHPVLEYLSTLNLPVVTTHWGMNNPYFSSVSLADEELGYRGAKYLIAKGHTKIAFLYRSDIYAGTLRLKGLKRALAEASLPFNKDLVVSYSEEDEKRDIHQGSVLTNFLLESQKNNFTAIFYFNDFTAIQGYKAIKNWGLKVGNDVSVLSVDDSSSSYLLDPPLTTFEHPKYHLGRWAANLLLDEIENFDTRCPKKLIFEPKLLERQSVKDIR